MLVLNVLILWAIFLPFLIISSLLCRVVSGMAIILKSFTFEGEKS
jgi:hypothetical protein